MRSREELVQWAKIAEQAERFEDMAESMKELTENLEKEEKKELTQEERNLLSVAYKNVVGARRSSWRMVSLIESKSENNPTKRELAKSFRAKIEKELDTICTEVFRLLQDHLLARRESLNNESLVFYLKMLGDYHRYQAEYATEEKKTEIVGSALQSYQNAYDMAMQTMEATNTNRLGLALNFSVFYYEIFNAPEKACHLAQDAFDSAITTIDELDQESYKDSTLIMQLLRDNLTLWTTDSTQECNDGDN